MRLRIGRQFRQGRPTPSGGAFLESFTSDEIATLQAPRLRWISKRLPDPRDVEISADHARIYWRIATRDFQSSQMAAELALVLLSGLLGVVLGALAASVSAASMTLNSEGNALLLVLGVIVIASAWAVATKTATGQRWQEAIELYYKIGWSAPVTKERPTFFQRILHCRFAGRSRGPER